MARFDYECRACGYGCEIIHAAEATISETCPDCGKSEFKKVFNFAPSFNASTIRVPSERTPLHDQWFKTEGERRLRLPDGHPDKLEMIHKSDDAAHGVYKERKVKTTPAEQQVAWANEYLAMSPDQQKNADASISAVG